MCTTPHSLTYTCVHVHKDIIMQMRLGAPRTQGLCAALGSSTKQVPPDRTSPITPCFSPHGLKLLSSLQSCKTTGLCCLKPLAWWWFLREVTREPPCVTVLRKPERENADPALDPSNTPCWLCLGAVRLSLSSRLYPSSLSQPIQDQLPT